MAPMEGVTDFAFRLWLSYFQTTGYEHFFLRVTPIYPAQLPKDFAPELGVLDGYLDYELLPQLMVANSEDFIRLAGLFKSRFVELNCGCPASVVVGNGQVAACLKNPQSSKSFWPDALTVQALQTSLLRCA